MKNLLTPTNRRYLASFMIGVGGILNIGSVYALPVNTGTPQDWQAIGNYLNKSMGKVNESRTDSR